MVNGFVVPVEQAGDFESAFKRKLFYEVAGSRPDARGDDGARAGAPLMPPDATADRRRDLRRGFRGRASVVVGRAPERAAHRPLPARVDVAVIGSGYCGLAAALELARAGVRVAVFDTGALGQGASSRNGGMVGGAVKLDWSHLAARYGESKAAALLDGARASFEHLEDLIAREGLDADYRRCGRVTLACNPAQFRALQREVRALGERARAVRIVPRERQREEIGSDFYHGGVVIEEAGGLHPGKLHRGLHAAARRRRGRAARLRRGRSAWSAPAPA